MDKDKSETKPKLSNDIKDLHSYKQLHKLRLDLESPRLLKACFNLGVTVEELQYKEREEFEEKGAPKDVIDLRYKVNII